MRQPLLFALISLAFATSARGTTPAVPLLIPIHVAPTAGARGSLWISELVVHNPLSSPASLLLCHNGCTELVVPPGSQANLLDAYRATPGSCPALLVGAYPGALSFALRVRDTSRDEKSFGVELPTVFVNNGFLANRLLLLNVPAQRAYRYNLRLYFMSGPPASVRVRVMTDSNGELVAEYDVALSACDQGAGRQDLSYAELDPLPEKLLAGREGQRLRMELLPQPDGYANWAWALLTITNNDTQEVTVVTPRYSQ